MYSSRNVSHSHTCIDNHRIIWTFVLILAVVLLFARNHPLASLYPAYSFFLWVSSVAIFRVYDMFLSSSQSNVKDFSLDSNIISVSEAERVLRSPAFTLCSLGVSTSDPTGTPWPINSVERML